MSRTKYSTCQTCNQSNTNSIKRQIQSNKQSNAKQCKAIGNKAIQSNAKQSKAIHNKAKQRNAMQRAARLSNVMQSKEVRSKNSAMQSNATNTQESKATQSK